jgi:dynein heavy chain
MITKGSRWVLNIDPQTQANIWIRNTHKKKLLVMDMTDPKYIDKISKAVQHGNVVLLQDVGEQLDPSLDNLFGKSLIKVGGEWCVKIGDNEIPFNEKFKLYITSRIPNPVYTPEVSTKVNVVNFSIKEQGLTEQCLGIVVQEKQPTIE